MTILLRTSGNLPPPSAYAAWLAVTGTTAPLNPSYKHPNLAAELEASFLKIRPLWWRLGREMGADQGAEFARAPTATAFGSDFGVMLAWSALIESLSADEKTHLVVCDDPWLFRHLAALPGIDADRLPFLWPGRLRLFLRGAAVRMKVALAKGFAAAALWKQRKIFSPGDKALLVYAHPRSLPGQRDDYFGNLMSELPALKRLLHADSSLADSRRLCGDGRTASLHAWGNPLYALRLITLAWKPRRTPSNAPFFWLIKRAAAIENGGGGPAAICWQSHCQQRWLSDSAPACVSWPWENHAWERNLCRATRRQGVRTIGYQHTVIGPHQINYAVDSNPNGLNSIPDIVVANGPAYARELRAWGIPDDRLVIGGAFRFKRFGNDIYDPSGPVFIPLSANRGAALQQVDAARKLARAGRPVLIKAHPMYPMNITEEANFVCTQTPLVEQTKLSAVVYSTGTSGLEAVLLDLPTYRLQLEDRIAIDVLPEGVSTPTVTVDTIGQITESAGQRPKLLWEDVFAPVDLKIWRCLLDNTVTSAEHSTLGPCTPHDKSRH